MRIIIALKLLITRYHRIIPTYIAASATIFIIGQMLPGVGAIIVLPVSIGVSYVMIYEVLDIKKRTKVPLFIGFKKGDYRRNLGFLFLRQLTQYLPLVIGIILDQIFDAKISNINIDLYFITIGWNFFIFAIPSAIISLVFSMVPYILADPRYDVKKINPLLVSAKLLRGNYLRLISIRLLFLPFMAWAFSGFFVSIVSVYSNVLGSTLSSPGMISSWLLSAPILFLLFVPWYRMTHAVLYGQIRNG